MTSKNKPVDQKLYDKIKEKVQIRIPKHSAYRSGTIVTEYKKAFKKKYGSKKPSYTGTKNKSGLSRWFKEDWKSDTGHYGYISKSSIYRPTIRVTKKTPKTFSDLSRKEILRAKREKFKNGKVKKF